jgi:hypothetical protein
MTEPFPVLTSLTLRSGANDIRTLPDSFLDGIPFPALVNLLLLSTSDLINLRLEEIPRSFRLHYSPGDGHFLVCVDKA